MKNSDITLLICGPLNKISIDCNNLNYYKSLGINILYSTWETRDENDDLLLNNLKCILHSEEIIISKYPDISNYDNNQNIYYHCYVWLQAVLNCKTKYVIKSRSIMI